MTSVNRASSCAAIATVIGLLVAGCAQTVATSKNLGQAHDTALGPVLVAPDGMTL